MKLDPNSTVQGELCVSCRLTRTRPNDSDTAALAAFAVAERAKVALIAELAELKLPIIGRRRRPAVRAGVRPALQREFDTVFTGHENG